MRAALTTLAILVAVSATACGGGGKSAPSLPVSPATPAGGNTASASIKLVIPNAGTTASAARKPAFVSPGTNGAAVTTYAHSDTQHQSPLATTLTDVSSGSGACTAGAGSRTCTISITAPAGSDDFAFVLYDMAPVNGAIPAAAHILGTAGVTQTIAVSTTNTINAAINGVIVGLSGQAALVPLAADGTAHAVGLTIAPTDFGNNAIVAGTSNAPFANPITVTLTESGGTGNAALQLNGGASATQVVVSKATDTVQVVYNGQGSPGYQAGVALTAPPAAGSSGATENAVIKPVLFVSNPTVFYAAAPAQVKTPSGCTNILTPGTVVGSGTNASLLVVGGTAISTSGCKLAISDGTTTFNIAVSNTLRAFGTPTFLHEYATGSTEPFNIVTGADGNLWFSEESTTVPSLSVIKPDGTGYTTHALNGFGRAQGVSLGGDGNVWVGDGNTNLIAKVTTAGATTTFASQTSPALNYNAPGLDGLTWFAEADGNLIGNLSTTGTLHEITVPNGGQADGITLGPDGAIWFADTLESKIGRVAGGTATEFAATTPIQPRIMAAGADGAVWFTEITDVGRMSTSGVLTEYPMGGSAAGFNNHIIPGPDGAMWFTDCGNSAIGRITTDGSGTVTEYTIPTTNATPVGITVGPDGNLWFTEALHGIIGVLQI
jgi:virginiamycin B lyase